MKPTIAVTLRLDRLKGIRAKLGSLAPAAGKIERGVRRIIAEEFRGGFGYGPSGGRNNWPDRVPFGDREAGLAFEGSAYAAAWSSAADEAAVRQVTPKTITVGVSSSRFPWASVHQTGAIIKPRRLAKNANDGRKKGTRRWREPQKWRMFWLLLGRGQPISAAKLRAGLRIPARPHARSSPQMREAAAKAYLSWLMEVKS